jgi:hypothetical protein
MIYTFSDWRKRLRNIKRKYYQDFFKKMRVYD